MKIRCLAANTSDLHWWPDLKACAEYAFRYPGGKLNLTVGREYVVYGLLLTSLCTWVFICEDDTEEYPYLYPMPLFTVIDGELPEDWVSGQAVRPFSFSLRRGLGVVSYPALAKDEAHYGALVDGQHDARRSFAEHKRAVDQWQSRRA